MVLGGAGGARGEEVYSYILITSIVFFVVTLGGFVWRGRVEGEWGRDTG